MTEKDLQKVVPSDPSTPNLAADNIVPDSDVVTDPKDAVATGDALDALLKATQPDTPEQPPEKEDADPEPEPKPLDPKPKPEPKPSAPPAKPATPPPSKAAETPPEKPVETAEAFDKVEIPPYTKPNTAQAFATVKQMARERLTALTKERDEIAAKHAEAEAKLREVEGKAGKLPTEVEQELTELRNFRKQMDVQYDPTFKEFDTQVTQNEESVFAKLKEAGMTEDAVKKAREIGLANLEWDELLPKLPSNVRRFVEAKLVQNDDLKDQKTRALEDAKKNADSFLKERAQAGEKEVKETQARIENHFNELLGKVSWSKRRAVVPTATPEEKTAAEAHNKFLDEANAAIKDAAEDNTPEMKAVLTLGYVNGLYWKRQADAHAAGLTAQQAAWDAEKAKLESTIAEQKTFIDKIKKSSSPSSRSVAGVEPSARPANVNESTTEALDRHRAELGV